MLFRKGAGEGFDSGGVVVIVTEEEIRPQRIECGEEGLGGDAGIDEPGIFGPADDVEDAQRELRLAGDQVLRLVELPPHGDAQRQTARVIRHEFPRETQQLAPVGGDGQLAEFLCFEEELKRGLVFRSGKDGIVELPAPFE